MLKLKQVFQGRILLLLLGEIVLGSLLFSMTACEEVNLTNQVINPLQQEQEVRDNFRTISNAQAAYRLEHNKFSNSFKELEITSATDSKNYRYRIYRGIQTTLNHYLFQDAEQMKTKYLKIHEEEAFTPPKKLPRISSDILMIAAYPKRDGLKTIVEFIFNCNDESTGGTDCQHEPLIFTRFYESEEPSTPPPNELRLKVSLPLAYCKRIGCLGEQIPTPEGFRPVEDRN